MRKDHGFRKRRFRIFLPFRLVRNERFNALSLCRPSMPAKSCVFLVIFVVYSRFIVILLYLEQFSSFCRIFD